MTEQADTVAIRMARTLADRGCDVRLYLHAGEWLVVAVAADGKRQVGFGFTVRAGGLVAHPQAFADHHAWKMLRELGQ
jgi:hypothetical protein